MTLTPICILDYQPGITAPPFHVWCRSTTAPYFDDDFGKSGERVARDEVTKDSKGDTIKHMDITDKWIKNNSEKGSVIKKQEYTINGETYKVDGKHVMLRPTQHEMEIADVLSEKYGKKVELVPQVVFPQGIQTPDYMIDGDRFDLKSPTGRGKNVIYGLIAKKRKQADNFIIDISGCPLSVQEVERQIEGLYASPRLGFLEMVVLMRDMKVLKVYGRK